MCKISMLQAWMVLHIQENCHSLGNICKPLFLHKDQTAKLANKPRKTCKTLYDTLQSMMALNYC